jgi:hypothetical protein
MSSQHSVISIQWGDLALGSWHLASEGTLGFFATFANFLSVLCG